MDLYLFQSPKADELKSFYEKQVVQQMDKTYPTHGLSWEDGTCPYIDLPRIMFERCVDYKDIYVENAKKARILEKIIKRPVTPVEETFKVKLDELPVSRLTCWYDHTGYDCAYLNTDKLLNWFKNRE